MRRRKSLFAAGAAVIACAAVLVWFCSSIHGREVTLDVETVETEVATPEYKTDAARAIDAYERLMDRYMELSERNLTEIADALKDVSQKLDSVDKRLKGLSGRLARVEKALNIAPADEPAKENPPETKEHKAIR